MKQKPLSALLGFGLIIIFLAGCSAAAPEGAASDVEPQAAITTEADAATAAATEAPQATATPAGAVISAENAANLTEIASWSGHACDFDLAFSPDSQNLVSTSCDQDAKVRVWDLASNTEQVWDHEGAGFGAVFSPDGSVLAVWSLGPKVVLFDVASGTEIRTLEHSDYIFDADISPDGTILAGAGGDGTVVLWDLASRNPLPALDTNMGEKYESLLHVTGVAFSPDGSTLVDVAEGGTMRLWDLASGTMQGPINVAEDASSQAVIFSKDGNLFAVLSRKLDFYAMPAGNTVTIFDFASQDKLRTFGGGSGAELIRGFDLSPDGSLLAIVLEDGTIVLYDVASGSELHRFAGGAEYVDVVVFSPDGRLIASEPRYPDENKIQVWGINP